MVFAGIREDSVEKARRSAQYKDAYATIGSVVGEIPLSEAVQGCKGIITPSQPAKASVKNTVSNTAGHTVSKSISKSVRNRVRDSVRK